MPAEVIETIYLLHDAPDLQFQYRYQQLPEVDTCETKLELIHLHLVRNLTVLVCDNNSHIRSSAR